MTRGSGPTVVLAAALIVAQAITVLTWDSVWTFAVGALLFALALAGADAWLSRLRAESSRPSRKGVLLALAFLAACALGTLNDPDPLADVMPILAGGAAASVLLRSNGRRNVRTTWRGSQGPINHDCEGRRLLPMM